MSYDNLAYCLYSHDSLEHMCKPFIGEQKQYFPIECKKYFFYNKDVEIDPDYETLTYDDQIPYAQRLYNLLEQVPNEFVLISHEDMFFYNDVDMEMFDYYFQVLQANTQFAYLKLLRGGESQEPPKLFVQGIYKTPDSEPYVFCVQPTVWKRTVLLSILSHCIKTNIWELEVEASKFMKSNKIQTLFTFSPEDSKRGLFHWDNFYFPFVASALCKGRWNTSEYPEIIHNFKTTYGIQ